MWRGWKQQLNNIMWKNTLDSTHLEYGLVGASNEPSNNFQVCPDEWPSAPQETYCSIQTAYKIPSPYRMRSQKFGHHLLSRWFCTLQTRCHSDTANEQDSTQHYQKQTQCHSDTANEHDSTQHYQKVYLTRTRTELFYCVQPQIIFCCT
jgi:hypothetical protein